MSGSSAEVRSDAGRYVPARGFKVLLGGLLDRAANLREHGISVRADQTDRTDDDHQNNGQHYRVFSDVLSLLVVPKLF
jgi:hypothetical protein